MLDLRSVLHKFVSVSLAMTAVQEVEEGEGEGTGGKATRGRAEGICQQLLQLFICTKNIAKCQMCVYIDQIHTRAHTGTHTHEHVHV